MSGPDPTRKPRRVFMLAMAIVIVFLILGEAALLITVFVSPGAQKSVSNKIQDLRTTWEGTSSDPGLKTRVGEDLSSFFNDQVKPLWQAPTPAADETTFARCISCHPDYQTKSRFTNVYMDHPVHAQEGIDCQTCHTMVQHPNPNTPSESVCQKCHDQVQAKNGCDFCHPPGTLPHFYLLGVPRDEAVNCDTCHRPGTFVKEGGQQLVHSGAFTGDPNTICLKCHQQAGAYSSGSPPCANCHQAKHPSDWVATHGGVVSVSQDFTSCQSCHTVTWCSSRCHPNSPQGNPKIPLPETTQEIPVT